MFKEIYGFTRIIDIEIWRHTRIHNCTNINDTANDMSLFCSLTIYLQTYKYIHVYVHIHVIRPETDLLPIITRCRNTFCSWLIPVYIPFCTDNFKSEQSCQIL